jgi:excisionase family DNA binding protein
MELLTIDDTAQTLKVSPTTVRRFIAEGRLPAVKVGKGVRVRKEAVEQLAQPVEPKARRERLQARPMTADDPMSKLVGSVTDAPPTDSSKKYEYLADAIAPKPR